MKVAAFTPGRNVPSARFRVRQFIAPLAGLGIELDEFVTSTDAYPPAGHWRRPAWAAGRLAELAVLALRSRRYDSVLLQREMISTKVTLERFTGRPRILDVDDAIHLARGGDTARRLAQLCARVIAGNSYLAEWYSRWCADVVILPTAIDSDRYIPATRTTASPVVAGWIGTSANHPYLLGIEPALHDALSARPDLHLKIVSDRPPQFDLLDPGRWTFVPWSEAAEVREIQSMDIGIMPLTDSEWARGKCSFKMLQYMSCGVPVVVSPFGMNAEVLAEGALGLAAVTGSEWTTAIVDLADLPHQRAAMGREGRAVIERRYATNVIAPKLARYLS